MAEVVFDIKVVYMIIGTGWPRHSAATLQTWTIRQNLQTAGLNRDAVANLLRQLLAIGYTDLEVSCSGSFGIADFLQLVRNSGMSCSGVHLPCLIGLKSREMETVIERHLADFHKAFPTRNPLFTTMGRGGVSSRSEDFISSLTEASIKYQKHLMNGGVCYHLYSWDLDTAGLLEQLAKYSVPTVIDTYFIYAHLQCEVRKCSFCKADGTFTRRTLCRESAGTSPVASQ